MQAIVLAAGYATRLYPLTKDRPKPLLPVGGRPVIDWILDRLAPIPGLEAVHVVTNHKFADPFNSWASTTTFTRPITVYDDGTLSNDDRLGAIGDMQLVIQRAAIDDELLVVAGDNLFDFEVPPLVELSRRHAAPAIGLRQGASLEEVKKFGVVDPAPDGLIRSLEEKPAAPKSTLFAICLYVFPRGTLPEIQRYLDAGNNPDAPGNYIAWLVQQRPCFGHRCPGTWFDIGDHAALAEADQFFTAR